jgi:predicted hydrocarbon binding protein
MRGVVTGWMEAFHNKKATRSVETKCTAMGAKFCIFEITMPD